MNSTPAASRHTRIASTVPTRAPISGPSRFSSLLTVSSETSAFFARVDRSQRTSARPARICSELSILITPFGHFHNRFRLTAIGYENTLHGYFVPRNGNHRREGWRWHTTASTTRSEEHTSELQSLMRNSYAVF